MTEPISLSEAKSHLRIINENTDSDTEITRLMATARAATEKYLGSSLVDKVLVGYFDEFTETATQLKDGPVRSITAIKYIDENGIEQTLSSQIYKLYDHNKLSFVALAFGQSWPKTQKTQNAVKIEYMAGYADPSQVPEPIRHAILLQISDLYENRTGQVDRQLTENKTVCSLLNPYRLSDFV